MLRRSCPPPLPKFRLAVEAANYGALSGNFKNLHTPILQQTSRPWLYRVLRYHGKNVATMYETCFKIFHQQPASVSSLFTALLARKEHHYPPQGSHGRYMTRKYSRTIATPRAATVPGFKVTPYRFPQLSPSCFLRYWPLAPRAIGHDHE